MKDLKIYFCGICGISMSALAKLCAHFGAKVSGSDDNQNADFNELTLCGIECSIGANKQKIDECDIFVYTIAVGAQNSAVTYAKSKNKQVFERAEFLGEIEKHFIHAIAISGTHGKTTTTAMLGNIFAIAGKKPTVHLGGESINFNGNLLLGDKDYFITEACEFNKSLLHLYPETAVITNIECDHMDTYKNLTQIQETFDTFATQTTKNVIINGDLIDKNIFKDTQKLVTFGLKENNDFYAKNIKQHLGKFEFDVYKNNTTLVHISLNVLGEHNVLNALACVVVSSLYNIKFDDIVAGIEGYSGVKRRLSLLTSKDGIKVYHDYAHHPTEIKTTLKTLKLLKPQKIIAIFQPHTYSRTKALMQEFSSCFSDADYLYILPTYPARESYILGGDAQDLFYNINGKVDCTYCTNQITLEYELSKQLQKGDILVWLGAGDIVDYANDYVQKLLSNK